MEFCVVYVTVPNDEVTSKITEAVLNRKLAACVNKVSGVESSYWWKEKIETDKEHLLIIKTRISLVDELTSVVKSNHPYNCPEVIAFPLLSVGNQGR